MLEDNIYAFQIMTIRPWGSSGIQWSISDQCIVWRMALNLRPLYGIYLHPAEMCQPLLYTFHCLSAWGHYILGWGFGGEFYFTVKRYALTFMHRKYRSSGNQGPLQWYGCYGSASNRKLFSTNSCCLDHDITGRWYIFCHITEYIIYRRYKSKSTRVPGSSFASLEYGELKYQTSQLSHHHPSLGALWAPLQFSINHLCFSYLLRCPNPPS